MNDIKICLLRYLAVVPIYIGLLIGVAFFTEMFIAIQAYTAVSLALLFLLWRVEKTWKEFFLYIFMALISVSLATYIGICGSLVSANGTSFILGGWSSIVAFNSLIYAYYARSFPRSEKKFSILGSLGSFAFVFLCLTCVSLMQFTEEVKPFPSNAKFFDPPTINMQVLNETYDSVVAHSRCSPPSCNGFIFDTSYSVVGHLLPDGFSAERDPYSKSSAIITFNRNASIPLDCGDFKVYLKCSAVYNVYIGSIWIGKQCPIVKSSPMELRCEVIDTTVANYVYWFGCIVVTMMFNLKWNIYQLMIENEKKFTQANDRQLEEIDAEQNNAFHSTETSEQ